MRGRDESLAGDVSHSFEDAGVEDASRADLRFDHLLALRPERVVLGQPSGGLPRRLGVVLEHGGRLFLAVSRSPSFLPSLYHVASSAANGCSSMTFAENPLTAQGMFRMDSPLITLTTDYGMEDHYVGVLKGVMAGISPGARVVDITHEIAPQDVRRGAVVLWQALPWFPEGSIHVVVVDPGVGTSRKVLLARFAGRYVIAPDNGLVTLVHREFPAEEAYVVENRQYFAGELSGTFHGRDMMAPVAAHLASGVKASAFGRVASSMEMLPIPYRAAVADGQISGEVLCVDRFGTLVTNIRRDQLPAGDLGSLVVQVRGRELRGVHHTFSDAARGELLALVGGGGLVEIAVNGGRADEALSARAGESVVVTSRA